MAKKPYSPKIAISEEQRQLLGTELLAEVKAGLTAKATLDNNVSIWNNQYEGVLAPKSDPWPNCSNLHIGITQWQVDTTVSNLANVVYGSEPIIAVNPREGGDAENAKALEVQLTYEQERIGLRAGAGREVLQATVKHGTGIGKLTEDTWDETIYQIVRGLDGSEEVGEKVIQRHGPVLHYTPIRDFVMCPADAISIQQAAIVGDRRRMRLSEIRKREGKGFYLPGTADEVAQMGPPQLQETTETQDRIGVESQVEIGQVGQFAQYHDVWELVMELPVKGAPGGLSYDPEGKKYRLCLVTLIGERPVLARLVIYPWFHGRKHYIPFRIKPREGQFWGIGLCQMLRDLNDEVDTEHNQRTDERSLRIKRPMIAKRGAVVENAKGERRIEFAPGVVIYINDEGDLKFMEVSNPTPDSANEEAMLLGYAERLTGVTEAKLGKIEAGAKTLGEINLTEAQGNVRFDDMVSCFQGYGDFQEGSGLKELGLQLIGLSWQFSTPEEKFRITGQQGQKITGQVPAVSLDDVIGAYDYIPQGNSLASNVGTRRQEAVLMYREMLQNPLVVQDPRKLWNATKRLLETFDVKDWQKVIGEEEEAVAAMQAAQQQQMALKQAEMAAKGAGSDGRGGMGGGEQEPITEEEVQAEMERMMQGEEAQVAA